MNQRYVFKTYVAIVKVKIFFIFVESLKTDSFNVLKLYTRMRYTTKTFIISLFIATVLPVTTNAQVKNIEVQLKQKEKQMKKQDIEN